MWTGCSRTLWRWENCKVGTVKRSVREEQRDKKASFTALLDQRASLCSTVSLASVCTPFQQNRKSCEHVTLAFSTHATGQASQFKGTAVKHSNIFSKSSRRSCFLVVGLYYCRSCSNVGKYIMLSAPSYQQHLSKKISSNCIIFLCLIQWQFYANKKCLAIVEQFSI